MNANHITLARPCVLALAATLTVCLTQPAAAQDDPTAGDEQQIVQIHVEKKQALTNGAPPKRIVVVQRSTSGDDSSAQIIDRPVGELTDGAIHVTIDDDSDFTTTQTVQLRVAMKPTTYLGVSCEPVPTELRAHLDVAMGQGLLVRFVASDSGASKAGLKENDILLQLDDQKLMNMQQLSALIQSHEKGDKVSLKVIHGGKTKTLEVTLGQRMAAQTSSMYGGALPGIRNLGDIKSNPYTSGGDDTDLPAIEEEPYINTQRIQRELTELRESIKKHSGELATELKALTEEASEEAARQSKIIAERALVEAQNLMEKVEQQQKMIMKRIEQEQKAIAQSSEGASSSAFTHSKTDRRESAVYHDGEHRLTLNVDAEGKQTLKVTQGDKVIYEGPVNNKLSKKLDAEVLEKFKKLQGMIAKAGKTDSN
jgi:hypothetical protein